MRKIVKIIILAVILILAACDRRSELSPQEITLSVKQEIEKFLSEFLSIFSDPFSWGWRDLETGVFYIRNPENPLLFIETDGTPLFYLGGIRDDAQIYHERFCFDGSSVYDGEGDRIANVLFVRYDGQQWEGQASLAYRFSLYDLKGDGVPVVVVNFADEGQGVSNWVNSSAVLYGFIDGAYREIGTMLPFYSFHISPCGEIIVSSDDGHWDAYYYLRFTDGGMELVLVDAEVILENYHGYWDFDTFHPLTELQKEITEILTP